MMLRKILIGAALLSLTACGKSGDQASDQSTTAQADAPVEAVALSGEAIFNRCSACHKVGAGAANGLGPQLNGISGRAIASVAGFNYSTALKGKGGNWDDANLDAYIASPAKWAPGTKMAFAGIPDTAERKALIDYLKTQK